MAEITTKKVSNLTADTTLNDTDTFLYGDSGGDTVKKAPLSLLKKSSNEGNVRPNMLLESNVANRNASSTTNLAARYVYENTSEIEVGVNYTVSVNVTSEDGCQIRINRAKNGYKIGDYPVEAGTQTLTVNFVYSQSQKDALGDSNEIRVYQNAATGDWSSTNLTTVVVNWIKLEKGTIASDWCPAKSEMLSSIQYPTLTTVTPESTSEILVGDSTNNAVKKSTLSNIFSVIANTLTASALTTTAKTIVGAINELVSSISTINTSLSKKQDSLSGNFVYCGSNSVTISPSGLASEGYINMTATFTDTSGATVFIPIRTNGGWINLAGCSCTKSGTTVTVNAFCWNYTSGTHGGNINILVHKFKRI